MAYYNNQLLSFMKPTAEQAQAEAQAANLPNQLLFGGLKAPQKEERKATLNSKNTSGKAQRTTGAASKAKEEKTAESLTDQESSAIADQAMKQYNESQDTLINKARSMQDFVGKNRGAKGTLSDYDFKVPSVDQTILAGLVGKIGQTQAEGSPQAFKTDSMNDTLYKTTLADYLEKKANPYAGVDLENLSSLTNQLFGSNLKMKNIPEPTIQLNNLVGSMNRIRDVDQERTKGALDIMKGFLKPVDTGKIVLGELPKAVGGQTSRGLATDEKYVTSAFGKVDEEYQKSATTVKTVENMLNKNTVFGTDVVLAQMARLAGDVGNIAIQEAGRYKFPTFDGTLNSFVAYLTSNPNKQATPEVVSAMKDFVATAKKSIEEKRVERLKTLNRNFGQTSTYKDLSQRLYDQNMSYRPAESATQSSPKGRLAELLKKAGGK